MYTAINAIGEIIGINNAIRGREYFCAACGSRLIMKCGDVVQHHFAHESSYVCDPWYSDNKGPWHRAIQSLFADHAQEYVIRSDDDPDRYHIADVCLRRSGKANIIFEFQQSPISKSEFEERSDFYIHNGRNIVNGKPINNIMYWIFFYADKNTIYERYRSAERKECVYSEGRRQYQWDHRCKQFEDLDFKNTDNPTVIFDLGDNFYIRVDYAFDGCRFFGGKTVKKSDFIQWAIHTGKNR